MCKLDLLASLPLSTNWTVFSCGHPGHLHLPIHHVSRFFHLANKSPKWRYVWWSQGCNALYLANDLTDGWFVSANNFANLYPIGWKSQHVVNRELRWILPERQDSRPGPWDEVDYLLNDIENGAGVLKKQVLTRSSIVITWVNVMRCSQDQKVTLRHSFVFCSPQFRLPESSKTPRSNF